MWRLFVSSRDTAMPVRTIQAVISSLAPRARLKRVAVSAHTLRHTFALGYLRDNAGKLVELASLLGHDSLDTTAFTRDHRATISRPTWSVRISMSIDDASGASIQNRRRTAMPVDLSEDELARHWSLTPADLAVIAECRGPDIVAASLCNSACCVLTDTSLMITDLHQSKSSTTWRVNSDWHRCCSSIGLAGRRRNERSPCVFRRHLGIRAF